MSAKARFYDEMFAAPGQIRPGYKFNVLVDQDIVFPGNYGG